MTTRARKKKTTKDNVLSIYGAVPAHGVPHPGQCELLRKLLALAEEGGMSGIVVAWIGPSTNIATRWEGAASAHDYVAAATMLQARVMAAWLETVEVAATPPPAAS